MEVLEMRRFLTVSLCSAFALQPAMRAEQAPVAPGAPIPTAPAAGERVPVPERVLIRVVDSTESLVKPEPRMLRALEDFLGSELKVHKHQPVKRGDVDKALKARGLDTGRVSNEQLVEVAKTFDAGAVLRIAVNILGKPYRPQCANLDPDRCPPNQPVNEGWGQNVVLNIVCLNVSDGKEIWSNAFKRAVSSTDAGPATETLIQAAQASIYDQFSRRPNMTLMVPPCKGT
jgi:hypothetical protein